MSPARLAFPLTLAAEQHALLGDCRRARRLFGEAREHFPDLQQSRTLARRQVTFEELCPS